MLNPKELLNESTTQMVLRMMGVSNVVVTEIPAEKLAAIPADRVEVMKLEGTVKGKPARLLLVMEK